MSALINKYKDKRANQINSVMNLNFLELFCLIDEYLCCLRVSQSPISKELHIMAPTHSPHDCMFSARSISTVLDAWRPLARASLPF